VSKETKYSIKDFQRDFPNDEACLELLFNTLHSKKCSCGGEYKKVSKRKQYQCSQCRYQIAPTANTIFHKSSTPLTLWFHSIFIFSNAKSGISAKELERQLGVTYKCAWRILSMIRKALKQDDDKLHGDVEIDTGFFGGKGKVSENNNLTHIFAKKSIVTVAVERGGRIKAEIMPVASAKTMQSFIDKNIDTNAKIMTDSSKVYIRSDKTHDRKAVNHSVGEYVRGNVHINTIETFFAHLKRSMKGTYKSISKQHLQSYLDSFVFHYNNRHNDNQRFGTLMGTLLRASR